MAWLLHSHYLCSNFVYMRISIKAFFFVFILIVPVILSGCLTCEKKEYTFVLTGPNSGKLTIKYINIFSSLIDSAGEIDRDYDELINMWLKGEKIERDFPDAQKIKKRLFEENGQLCGEVVMEFDKLENMRLYRFNHAGPFMFSLSAFNDDGENFFRSNGEYGGDKMPVLFWPDFMKTLTITTRIADPDTSVRSMLPLWKARGTKYVATPRL